MFKASASKISTIPISLSQHFNPSSKPLLQALKNLRVLYASLVLYVLFSCLYLKVGKVFPSFRLKLFEEVLREKNVTQSEKNEKEGNVEA